MMFDAASPMVVTFALAGRYICLRISIIQKEKKDVLYVQVEPLFN